MAGFMVRAPRTNAGRREIRGEAPEKRLGLIYAFARDEEVNAIDLVSCRLCRWLLPVVAQDSFAPASDIGDGSRILVS
jgi:hypothetical protein